ncbi:MAG: HAD family hydrolase [Prevotella sp.]|nr:HAD family hydrolase [Prevotella sp.]
MTKGIIFDFGGTLDTGGNHWGKVMWHAWERQDIPVSEEQFREAYIYAERTLGRNPIILPTYTFKKMLDVKLRLQFEYVFTRKYWMTDKEEYGKTVLAMLTDLYEMVQRNTTESRQVLLRLKEKYQLALVTNFYGNMPVVLQEFCLDGIFQQVTESAVAGVRKPGERLLRMGVDALGGNPAELIVVGDSIPNDIIPAKRMGCRTVWLKGEGWDDASAGDVQPDMIVESINELEKCLL